MLDGYEYVSTRREYSIYRKIIDGKGHWKAKNQRTGEVFDITYEQALGYEGIDNAEKLSIEVGKKLFDYCCFSNFDFNVSRRSSCFCNNLIYFRREIFRFKINF